MNTHPPTLMLYRCLRAAALMGELHGLDEDAQVASAAVAAWTEDRHAFTLCRILARALSPDPARAQQALDDVLAAQPEDAHAQVIHAVLLARLNQPEWLSVLERVLATSHEQVPRDTALRILTRVREAMNSTGIAR